MFVICSGKDPLKSDVTNNGKIIVQPDYETNTLFKVIYIYSNDIRL